MRLALLLLAFLMPIAMASDDDGYDSMYGSTWSTYGSHGFYHGSYMDSYYPSYAFWPYPSVPAKYEVQAARERLRFNKYLNPYSAWWQVQAAKERLSALRYAGGYYDFYEVPIFRGRTWEDKSYRYRSYDDTSYGDWSYDEKQWHANDGYRKKGLTDDSPEDTHIPIADEIKMELEKEGVVSSSGY